MLLELCVAVWNHPQGRAAIISAIVAAPVYINTPATRDLLWRFGPTLCVVLGIALASLPSGPLKQALKEIAELRAEVARLKRAKRRR